MNLERYKAEQQKVIESYFAMLKDTRLTGKISENVIRREIEYWKRFSPEIVVEALRIHIEKYPYARERYTRGIMRNLEAQGFQGRTPFRRKDKEDSEELKKELGLLNSLRTEYVE